MQVEEYLGKHGGPVFTVKPGDTMAEAARGFSEPIGGKKYSCAVVVEDDGTVLGMLSLGDITWFVGRLEERAPKLEVRNMMTEDVVTCGRKELLEDVLGRMAERGIRHVPVVEDGKLVGLVARREALEFLYKWAKLDAENLTDWLFTSHARY